MRATLPARMLGAALLLGLSGCLLGPNYVRPAVDVPATYRFAQGEAADIANTAWWGQFQDPVLDQLIATALQENRDVKIAAARVDEYRGQFVTTRSGLFPQVAAGADASRQRISQSEGVPLPKGVAPIYNQFDATLSVAWELDLFGKVRRETEAARANLLASEEGRRAMILTLVGAVASAYINLRSLDRQLEIAKETVQSRAESVRVFEARFHGGEVSQMELAQSQSEYQAAQVTIPQLEAQIAQQEDALSVLIGTNPGAILRGRELAQMGMPRIPAGLPSDLLERRPDLLEAEQTLVAQNALIGAARALYFPSISLTGLFGSVSAQFSNLFTGPARVWSFAGSVTQPIFTAGSIAGQVHQAEARQQQALFAYEKAIQVAFQEVEDSLVSVQKTREALDAQNLQIEALHTYAYLARQRYEGGYTSYIEVLDAERSLFNAQLSYTQTQGAVLTSFVTLYKAMGGGWVQEAEKLTVPPAAAAPASSTAPASPTSPTSPTSPSPSSSSPEAPVSQHAPATSGAPIALEAR
ncbi:efflux transporter outer membrane subunit [Paraburkholderia antibiotica]|uniref:Efflux transporter outer membrane subunit n=1 Tax=Paraburkholderia antibiotica TaxID=2728839 RepID=A0A7X9X344_9BURK|nr:efflux transporter outer membrane subunit [Paraburkholderia antibiotica]NML30545.1 efflux transporter outer membrane subunit [Paraburkholderia antibiotica]